MAVTLGFMGFFMFMIGFLVLLAGGYFVYINFFNNNKPKNEEIIINGLSGYTEGHGLLLKKEEDKSEDIIMMKCVPRDIDYIKLEDDEVEVKKQNLFARKDLKFNMGFSSHRNMSLVLPDNKEDLPETMDKDLKAVFGLLIDAKNSGKDINKIENLKYNNLLEMTKKTEGLELYEEAFSSVKDITKDMIILNKNTQQDLEKK